MGWFDATKPRKIYGSPVSLDGTNYYAIIFPPKLTRDRAEVYRDLAEGLKRGDLPVLLDFSRVEQFDTSGLAFLQALVMDQASRAFFHRGMPPVVTGVLDVYDFHHYLRARVQPLPVSKRSLDAMVA